MAYRIGAKSFVVLGIIIVFHVPSRASFAPSESVINKTFPPRAITSCMLETVLSNKSSFGANTITGIFSSTNAIGPCFNSPLA